MNGIFNLTTKLVAFGDPVASSNPRLKYVDWLRDISGVPVTDPQSESHTIAPGGSKTVFDGTMASTIDGTTAFSLALSTVDGSTYRLTHTGGTAPGFRTGRALALNGVSVTITVNSNSTVTMSVPVGPDFAALQVSDEVFIPHTTTGDTANVISVLNAGYWVVLGKSSNTSITLMRPTGQDFEAVSQTVTLTSNNQIRGFSATGLRVGDHIDISAGFALPARKTFELTEVNDLFVEFVCTTPLAAESGVLPGASGLTFFSESKVLVYVEASQECAVRVNGDTTNRTRLSPLDPANASSPAPYLCCGPHWSLVLVNLSAVDLNVTVIHCE
jgi:hypothetical protein